MVATRTYLSQGRVKPSLTTKLATRLSLAFALAAMFCCLFSIAAFAQGSLSLGTVDTPTAGTCNSSDGWYSYTDPNSNVHPVICLQTTVRGCSNAADWPLTFGYLSPAGIVPGISAAKGTIVLFTGDGGGLRALPGNTGYVDMYFKAGYEIVELAWNDDWEYTYHPFQGTEAASIQNAACRPATFLKKYVYDVLFNGTNGILGQNPQAGFCGHGASAGSAQIAYSLAYYGAGSWLDNVELLSGPVFSDIKQGCEVSIPPPSAVTVCGQTNYKGGQFGCQLGSGGSTWALSPSYVGVGSQVGLWTDDASCQNQYPAVTTPASNAAWLAQSVVDQSTGAVPTFNYSSTAMSAWLCRSVAQGYGLPNNSSPQGQIFYANIGQANSPPNYAVYAVDNCEGDENVGSGTVPGFIVTVPNGSTAIVGDMVGSTTYKITAQCFRRTH